MQKFEEWLRREGYSAYTKYVAKAVKLVTKEWGRLGNDAVDRRCSSAQPANSPAQLPNPYVHLLHDKHL